MPNISRNKDNQIIHCLIALLLMIWILGNMCIVIVFSLFPVCDVINFEINLPFPINSNLGGLLRGSFWGGRGVKSPPPSPRLNLVKIMLETWNLVHGTNTYTVSENIPFSTKTSLILLMSAFFCKKSAFFGKINTFTQSKVWELC